MTLGQLKKKPIKQIVKIRHEKLDKDEGESNKDEEESTTSTELSRENSATADDTEESKSTETLQVHNVLNETMIQLKINLLLKLNHLKRMGPQ